ncbi:MAG: thiazole synthase [Leptospiraceae bacterium]|nr:thiazole synthase [Leptospiraceae bacterium]MDW8306121.1 thiazole synthase [Leptospiraceae bacterium]
MEDTPLKIGKYEFRSRLILGTGRYASLELMKKCHEAAGVEIVTVALRRVPLGQGGPSLLDYIDTNKIKIMPNTSGAYSAREALRLAELALALGMDFLKIEVLGDIHTLLPDPVETYEAVRLIRQKYDQSRLHLLVYTNDDPVLALKLRDAGADAIMPAGSPIGSGRGIANEANLIIMREQLGEAVPLIVDAGLGCASDASRAMELGADGVLLNSAVALAKDPMSMAIAMKHAVIAGRLSYLAGRIPKKLYGTASSPL